MVFKLTFIALHRSCCRHCWRDDVRHWFRPIVTEAELDKLCVIGYIFVLESNKSASSCRQLPNIASVFQGQTADGDCLFVGDAAHLLQNVLTKWDTASDGDGRSLCLKLICGLKKTEFKMFSNFIFVKTVSSKSRFFIWIQNNEPGLLILN